MRIGHSEAGGDAAHVERLQEILHGRRIVALTGAGCSTDSGIPDYGGLASRKRRTRIQYGAFVNDATARARYWARSMVGWERVADAAPNEAHHSLASLERTGRLRGIITQNVDGLHHRAGNQRIVELHGSLSRVRCLDCGAIESRAAVQERLLALNPVVGAAPGQVEPDGDADVVPDRLEDFRVPACTVCGGILKPDVVFFGENVPPQRVEDAWTLYGEGDVLLVAGSSLAVFSGYRFVLRAANEGKPVVIVNQGDTRGDEYAMLKLEAPLRTTLPDLVRRLDA